MNLIIFYVFYVLFCFTYLFIYLFIYLLIYIFTYSQFIPEFRLMSVRLYNTELCELEASILY
jgi:hypothetical protein